MLYSCHTAVTFNETVLRYVTYFKIGKFLYLHVQLIFVQSLSDIASRSTVGYGKGQVSG